MPELDTTLEYANKEEILDALNRAFAERFNSLAQYILDARPYITPEDKGVLMRIREVAEFDRHEAERLADTIDTLGGIPQVTAYDPVTAELNYLAIEHLRKVLVEALRKQVDAYDADLPLTQDCPPAHHAFTGLTQGLRTLLQMLDFVP